MSGWLSQANISNKWKQSYLQGFLHMNGGNLIVEKGDAYFYSNVSVTNNTIMSGPVSIGTSVINPNMAINIQGNAQMSGSLNVNSVTLSTLVVSSGVQIAGDIHIVGNLTTGDSTSGGGGTSFPSINISQNANIGNTLSVAGRSVLNGPVVFSKGGIYQQLLIDNSNNIALGNLAFQTNSNSANNIALGFRAMFTNPNAGTYNTIAIGQGALQNNGSSQISSESIAIGKGALQTNNASTTMQNIAIGSSAISSTSGTHTSYNIAIGTSALFRTKESYYNNVIGYFAAGNSTPNFSGSNNNALGDIALFNNTTGSQNTAIGTQALYNNTAGSKNTAIGQNSGSGITTGINNSFLGAGSMSTGDFSYSTAIGQGATINASRQIVIGTVAETTYIPGNVAFQGNVISNFVLTANANISGTLAVTGNTTLSNLAVLNAANLNGTINVAGNAVLSNLRVNYNGNVGGFLNVSGVVTASSFNATSDRRLKSNIVPLGFQANTILQVQPVSFEWNRNKKSDCGFIAQEVYNAYPILRPDLPDILGNTSLDEPLDNAGNPIYYSMDYGRMTPFLWQGMREILQRLDTLEKENAAIKELLAQSR